MVGSPEKVETETPGLVYDVMARFGVDEKTTRQLLGYSAVLASEIVAKWKRNTRAVWRRRILKVQELVDGAKAGDSTALEAAAAELTSLVKPKGWEC